MVKRLKEDFLSDVQMDVSERGCIEAASEEVSHQFRTLLNSEDVDTLKHLQLLILGRLQDSNAVLSHFNDFSEQCYAEVVSDFTRSTHVLRSMKADLDHIFQTLRSMKAKISSHYPDAFKEASIADQRPDLETPL
ncbi:kxDL motif-containing protein 1 isoform X2 [Amborella trichopoda]|uniref:kxDL motif-containing protein 1 isoform X2 n=1 Tax=Amborella trichopoda TaxID=13333 RepID=UPI0009BD9BBC|nr:kxDL motif-containing protein 1 isoform X2 [Amborella trichopoda]|eukprot:XP_020523886.1 kxDL motif-containing protein 1 isoform X2 [Amborella trichopoda]